MADDIENDGVDTEETEEVTEDTGEWTPPGKRDWDNLHLALKKARQDARAAKRQAKAETDPDAPKPEDIERAAIEKADAKYKPVLVRQAARAAFAEAGLLAPKGKTDAALSRVMRLLDHDDLDVDENGDISGLDDQISEIKAEFPELFVRKGGQRVDGADRTSAPEKKSSADVLASFLSGKH